MYRHQTPILSPCNVVHKTSVQYMVNHWTDHIEEPFGDNNLVVFKFNQHFVNVA